jgi:hypothetical protein
MSESERTPPVAVDGRVRVCQEMCSTCIFRPGNLMHLRAGRVRQMIDEARAHESAIICHSTLDQPLGAVCRGYYDRHADEVWTLRLARFLEVIEEVQPPSLL